ncbi:hypothetical protein Pla123a_15030 [Posidoniimonas polymericola]|uniref:Tim44-like domain protein n=1 Tax=Posidoniimonas polymericola TaxID=2528002 RepID=A0A5C5YSU1_9BACT|nr:hypothetical protein [Posidoniimonas polymericola]TWT77707.1 hypothetical protein Pla123a_15030 [Posidoniimonas polymericola]
MDYFVENTAPIWVLGALLLTMTGIAYVHTRRFEALLAMVAAVALTAVGLIAEQLIVTPREEVQATLAELLERVEANDLQGVLTMVAPTADDLSSDAQALMPLFDVHKARATGEVEVQINNDVNPPEAVATFRFFADVSLYFNRDGDRWVINAYSTTKDWRRDAARL